MPITLRFRCHPGTAQVVDQLIALVGIVGDGYRFGGVYTNGFKQQRRILGVGNQAGQRRISGVRLFQMFLIAGQCFVE